MAYYELGSVVIGVILVVDNVLVIKNKGVVNAGSKEEQGGLSQFFMLILAGWIGASLIQLNNGEGYAAVPLIYLVLSAFMIIAGVVFKNPKNLRIPDWVVLTNLVGSIIFTLVALTLLP